MMTRWTLAGSVGPLDRFDDEGIRTMMLGLIDDASTSLWGVVVALVVAAGIGAMHALGPGHGKLVIGGYLASSSGRARDAVALGGLVALMHSGSVLALGLVFHTSARLPASDRLDAALSIATGSAVVVVGAVMLHRQLRRRRARRATTSAPARAPDGPADGPVHEVPASARHLDVDVARTRRAEVGAAGEGGAVPAGSNDLDDHHDDHHHDLPPGVAPLSRAGVAALAASGGLLPSPAAFAVLVTALAIGRTGYGLSLVAAFGVGLAATLTVVGLLVLRGRDGLTRGARSRPGLLGLAAAIPLVGSLVVLGGGTVMVVSAVLRW